MRDNNCLARPPPLPYGEIMESLTIRLPDVLALEEGWAAQVPAGPPRFRSAKKQKLAEIIRAKKLHR